MNNNKKNSKEIKDDVKVKQINPRKKLNNLEKTAILQFKADKETNKMKKKKEPPILEPFKIDEKNYKNSKEKMIKYSLYTLKYSNKESNALYIFSFILSAIVLVFSGGSILRWYIQGQDIKNLNSNITDNTKIEELADVGELYNIDNENENDTNKKTLYWKYLNTPLSSVDFTELTKENKDTIGWLIVKNTNVNYPVVQTKDNDYYLNHSFDRKANSAGWVFADFRDNFNDFKKNTIIYAHGRKDKVMFGSLTNALDESWYKVVDNQLIQLSTLKYNTMWQIFSVYKVKAESYYIYTQFNNDAEYEKFLKTMKDRSIYNFGIDLTKDDKILTLSTCFNDNGIRLVVQAKLVKIQERDAKEESKEENNEQKTA